MKSRPALSCVNRPWSPLLAVGLLWIGLLPTLALVVREDVNVPMRDGVRLSANLFLPSDTQTFPVVLMRTPYNKGGADNGEARRLASRGYAVVIQDCRGRFDSEGEWDPFRHDAEDGYDTQEWVGEQSWCNGRIGTMGGSYGGFTQWSSAPLGSDYVKAMIPVVPFADAYHSVAYVGGAYQFALCMGWGTMVSFRPGETPPVVDWAKALRYLPLRSWDESIGRRVDYLRDWVAHPTYDAYWRARGIEGRYADVTVPILNVGGWYDIFSKQTLELFREVRLQSKSSAARRHQHVIMGPWAHGANQTRVGEIDFGEVARLDLEGRQDEWFDLWLKGVDDEVKSWPPLYLFTMGENRWRGESEWPLARTRFTRVYLRGEGQANTLNGDGQLSFDAPTSAEPVDTFVYDPDDPVPSHGGNNLVGATAGPDDQSGIEERDDVLVYTGDVLSNPVEVTGPVRLVLFAATMVPDTDFTAKLVDVYPDGKAYNLCEGILRARYRESGVAPALIEPGRVLRYEIDLWVTSNLFAEGHRIRLEVSSSNFPRFDRNPNTGKPFGADAEVVKANQTIYHSSEYPSHVVLPIIPRDRP